MKKLGLLFGVELLLNTDDEQIAEKANKFLEKLIVKMKTDDELEAELERFRQDDIQENTDSMEEKLEQLTLPASNRVK